MTRSLRALATLILALAACSSTSMPQDAGPADAGATDAGAGDAGALDAGPLDAGPIDAGAGDAGSLDAGPGDAGIDCTHGVFPTFDRTCAQDSDCTIAMHQTDCCGSDLALGIASSAAASFNSAETACEGMYPACGCFSGRVTADDGSMAPPGSGASAIVVHCASNACTTTVRSSTQCDSATCTPTQVCVQECSGIPLPPDAGPLPSKCVDVPAACATSSSCDCFGPTDPCPTGQCVSVVHGAPVCMCA